MTGVMERSLKAILVVGAVALLWLTVFRFNILLFSNTALSERIHWIFLPAAFRIIAVLIYGWRGAVGLMLGAYLTLPHANPDDVFYEILLSISSGVAPLIAVLLCQRLFTIRNDLSGLNAWHVIALSISCAFANSIVLNLLMWAMGKQQNGVSAVWAIFVGDVLGAAIVIGAIALVLDIALRFMRRT